MVQFSFMRIFNSLETLNTSRRKWRDNEINLLQIGEQACGNLDSWVVENVAVDIPVAVPVHLVRPLRHLNVDVMVVAADIDAIPMLPE